MPELPNLSVDGYCHETRKVYEFLGCYRHGHTCLPFRDVSTMNKDTLSERYEQTIARLERITRAVYQVEVEWECNFDSEIMPHHPELKTDHVVQHSPLNTRNALYGGRTEAMSLTPQGRGEGVDSIL